MTDNIILGEDRVMAAINCGDAGYVHLHFIDYVVEDGNNFAREAFAWKIFDEDMVLVGQSGQGERPTDDAIMGPTAAHVQPMRALGTLLAVLAAAAEAYGNERSDNADLFPKAVMEWAHDFSDEITMLYIELEESNGG